METVRTRIDPFNPPINPGELRKSRKRLQAMALFTEFETIPTSYFHKVLGYQSGKDKITELNGCGYIRIAGGLPQAARRAQQGGVMGSHSEGRAAPRHEAQTRRRSVSS